MAILRDASIPGSSVWGPPTLSTPCGLVVSGSEAVCESGYVRASYSGARTPRYHQQMKAGALLPLNSYERTDIEGTRSSELYCDFLYQCNGALIPYRIGGPNWALPQWAFHGLNTMGVDVPDPWVDVDTNALLLAAMADMLPDLDALTTLVESKQTIKMVVNARRDAKDLIREALRGGKHTVKAASDAWLAWRYGWNTLGHDIKNIYDAIRQPITSVVVEGRTGKSIKDTTEVTEHLITGSASFDWEHLFTFDTSLRANAVGVLQAKTLNAVADPAITMWESVPYSFVADWFVNIGDVLAAWKVRQSLSAVRLSLGTKQTITHTVKASNVGPGTMPQYYVNPSISGSMKETVKSKTRYPASLPTFVPSIDVNLTSLRIADAAALLAKRIL